MEHFDQLITTAIAAGVSFLTAYSTARYVVAIEHKKQAVPFTIRFIEECNQTMEIIVDRDRLRDIISTDDNNQAVCMKAEFIRATEELFIKKYPSYRPYISNELTKSIDSFSAKFLASTARVSKMNFDLATQGRLPTDETILADTGLSSNALLNKHMKEAYEALDPAIKAAESWLTKNT